MLRYVLCIFLLLGLFPGGRTVPADEKKSGEKAELKKFRGRWTTSHEWKEEGKARRHQLALEFEGGTLEFFTEEDGKWSTGLSLDVIGVERGEDASRLVLGREGQKGCVVYYDFHKEKLILVGSCPPYRPFCGFPLSGEYKRAEKPK